MTIHIRVSMSCVVCLRFGGRLADKIKPTTLRKIVITIGLAAALIYFVR